MIELASAISALDDVLRKKARGDSLERLYAEVPAPLRGYVELVYDLNHHPALRLLDGLLYGSRYYKRALQHFSFGIYDRDFLPYERSTPVLDHGQQVLASLPWDDRRLDDLFACENLPVRIEEMQERLGLEARHHARFRELFTTSPAPQRLCLADSCNLEPSMYWHIVEHLGPVDALFLGMECEGSPMSWGYGHLLTQGIDRKFDQARRDRGSNAAEANALIDTWRPSQAYVYAVGQEPWLNHVLAIDQTGAHPGVKQSEAFIDRCRSLGITSERLFGQKEILLPSKMA